MITILFSSLLFILAVLYTFSCIPKSKIKLSNFFPNHKVTPIQTPEQPINELATKPLDENQLKKSIMMKSESLRSIFATFDKNNDGFITKHELSDSLHNIGIYTEENEIADMVQKVDSNGDGLIDFDEFCELYQSFSGSGQKLGDGGGNRDSELKEAFDVFDGNKDGLITVDELSLVLSSLGFMEGKRIEACMEMIMKVDVDGDGMVNFDEFKTMMKDGLLEI